MLIFLNYWGWIVSDANPSRCGRTVQGANRLGGESTMGRIVQRFGETSLGRNAQWQYVLLPRWTIDLNTYFVVQFNYILILIWIKIETNSQIKDAVVSQSSCLNDVQYLSLYSSNVVNVKLNTIKRLNIRSQLGLLQQVWFRSRNCRGYDPRLGLADMQNIAVLIRVMRGDLQRFLIHVISFVWTPQWLREKLH